MKEKENTYCKRCHVPFECKVNDISNCQCAAIKLNQKTQEHIKTLGNVCLCINCLTEVNNSNQ